MARPPERVVYHGPGNPAHIPCHPQAVSLLQNLRFVSGGRKKEREQRADRQTAPCAGPCARTIEQKGVRKLFVPEKAVPRSRFQTDRHG